MTCSLSSGQQALTWIKWTQINTNTLCSICGLKQSRCLQTSTYGISTFRDCWQTIGFPTLLLFCKSLSASPAFVFHYVRRIAVMLHRMTSFQTSKNLYLIENKLSPFYCFKVILYSCNWHFVAFWQQIGNVYWKQTPIFVTVLLIAIKHEYRDSNVHKNMKKW